MYISNTQFFLWKRRCGNFKILLMIWQQKVTGNKNIIQMKIEANNWLCILPHRIFQLTSILMEYRIYYIRNY